jgi:nucleotide-binding universal stress UspA family protein
VIQIQHVICPVDLSDCSRRALVHAFAWARRYQSDLRVLHIVAHQALMSLPDGDGFTDVPELPFDLRAEVARFVADVAPPDASATVEILEGEVADTIARLSDGTPSSVLVMGTHGRTGFQQFLIASVTVDTLHRVHCPALIVPPSNGAAAGATATVKRILVAVDFRPSSTAALGYALSLAEELDAHLEVLHVISSVPNAIVLQGRPRGLSAAEHRMRERALAEIRRLIPDDARASCSIEERVTEGPPDREIVRRACETRAELLVIGFGELPLRLSHRLGLTTERVLRVAPCPVLIVPWRLSQLSAVGTQRSAFPRNADTLIAER